MQQQCVRGQRNDGQIYWAPEVLLQVSDQSEEIRLDRAFFEFNANIEIAMICLTCSGLGAKQDHQADAMSAGDLG